MKATVETEAVEVCPYCEAENVFPNWNVETDGYIAQCAECGEEIFLCDECMHADDNKARRCDFRETETSRKCFRGTIAATTNAKMAGGIT